MDYFFDVRTAPEAFSALVVRVVFNKAGTLGMAFALVVKRKRLVHTLEQLTHYASLADSEVHQEDPVFGSMLYAHLINVGIAQQTDGSVHLTQRGKDLLFILACYLDATITESANNEFSL